MTKKKKLTINEMTLMEINHLEKRIRTLEIEVKRKELLNHSLQKEIVEHRMKDKKRNIECKIKELEDNDKERNSRHKKFTQELKKKHKVKGDGFGFNPDTGEIIEENI